MIVSSRVFDSLVSEFRLLGRSAQDIEVRTKNRSPRTWPGTSLLVIMAPSYNRREV
jgi:hypothetical protein